MTRSRPLHCRNRAGTALVVVCLALLLCAPAQAGRPGHRNARPRPVAATQVKPVTPAVPPATAPAAVSTGMVVSIEPGTGRLVMPSLEEMLLLSAAEKTGLLRTSEGLTEIHGPDGAIGVDLQGRFMEYSLVHLDPTGRPHFFCVNDEIRLWALLAHCAPASTPAWEEK